MYFLKHLETTLVIIVSIEGIVFFWLILYLFKEKVPITSTSLMEPMIEPPVLKSSKKIIKKRRKHGI